MNFPHKHAPLVKGTYSSLHEKYNSNIKNQNIIPQGQHNPSSNKNGKASQNSLIHNPYSNNKSPLKNNNTFIGTQQHLFPESSVMNSALNFMTTLNPKQIKKQQLKQTVQQEMLNNYYISKYSSIMSKMTNQPFKLIPLDQRRDSTLQSKKKSIIKSNSKSKTKTQRQNFKKQIIIKRKNKHLNCNSDLLNEGEYNANKLSALSPFKSPQNKNRMKADKKLLNSLEKGQKQFSIAQENKNFQKNQSRFNSFSRTPQHKLLLKSEHNNELSNFKESLVNKKHELSQRKQENQIYKRLQSSIINQLYSPSPKKIENQQYNGVQIVNKNYNKYTQPEYLNIEFKSNEKNTRKQFSDRQKTNTIEINEMVTLDTQLNNQFIPSLNGHQNKNKFLFEIKSKIRQSILQNALSSSRKEFQSPEKSRKSQNSFIDSKNKKASNLSSSRLSNNSLKIQNEKWNDHFSNKNSFNRGSLSSQKYSKSSPRNPAESPVKRTHSLQKTFEATQRMKDIQSKLLTLNSGKNSNIRSFIKEQHSDDQEDYQQVKVNSARFNSNQGMHVRFLDKNSSEHKALGQSPSANQLKYKQEQVIDEKKYFQEDKQPSQNGQQQDGDIQFIPPANYPQINGDNRSRRASQSLSFSDFPVTSKQRQNQHSMLSMLSRFSMTSQEGFIIKQKLQNQIVQNQFGPYQHALEMLRDLINEFPNAWPIYVVGQRVLDDRKQYEKKIDIQNHTIENYKNQVQTYKNIEDKVYGQSEDQYQIRMNQSKILKMIRQLGALLD